MRFPALLLLAACATLAQNASRVDTKTAPASNGPMLNGQPVRLSLGTFYQIERDMDAKLAGKFIGMYVNEFTRDYGEGGRAAIRKFLTEAHHKGYIDVPVEIEFVE